MFDYDVLFRCNGKTYSQVRTFLDDESAVQNVEKFCRIREGEELHFSTWIIVRSGTRTVWAT